MNLRNRIRKIETGLGLNIDPAFCRCEREIIIKVQPRNKRGELPEAKPETCGDCGKPIDRFHFTFNFNNNIQTKVIRPSYRVIEPGDEIQKEQINNEI